MNIALYAIVLVAALMAKTGSFSFYAGTKKKIVSVVSEQHVAHLGKFSFAQANQIAKAFAVGQGSTTIRMGADDYTFMVSDA
jgi:hypothetical protein